MRHWHHGLWALVLLINLSSFLLCNGEKEESHNPIVFALQVVGVLGTIDQKYEKQTELKVIGAGMPRTGTKSTKAALEKLGYKVFHMDEFNSHGLASLMTKALMSDYYLDEFTNVLLSMGYNATLDMPGQALALRWAKKFPKAKVLLGVRDSPNQFAKSIMSLFQAFRFVQLKPFTWIIDLDWYWGCTTNMELYGIYEKMNYATTTAATSHVALPWFRDYERTYFRVGGDQVGAAAWEEAYLKWNERVVKQVPSERLLVFNVKEGWDKLCSFLGVKKPSERFPHINEAESLKQIEAFMGLICKIYPVLILVGFLFFIKMTNALLRRVGLRVLL